MADGTTWSQPSLSLPARPISACTTPFLPGQNLNTSAIPAPPSLIPQPSPPCLPACLPTYPLPLLYMLCSALSAFYFYSPLAWPCLFPVTSFETEEATSNWQSSHPNSVLTSLSSFSGAVQRLPLVQSHPFVSIPCAPSSHSFIAAPSLL